MQFRGSSSLKRLVLAILLAVPAMLVGCAATPDPAPLRVEAGSYDQAFDAALAVMRDHGLEPTIRDRRGGIIETDPALAPSLLQPWRGDPGTLQTRLNHTAQHVRRRARIEFTPIGQVDSEAAGPDLLGLAGPPTELGPRAGGDLEMRVSVFLEQSHEPGLRRSTWSRKATSKSIVYPPGDYDQPLPVRFWSPVSRDPWFEASVLDAVSARTGLQGNRQVE